ncbi:Importin subunit alpha [Entamoeba marina]
MSFYPSKPTIQSELSRHSKDIYSLRSNRRSHILQHHRNAKLNISQSQKQCDVMQCILNGDLTMIPVLTSFLEDDINSYKIIKESQMISFIISTSLLQNSSCVNVSQFTQTDTTYPNSYHQTSSMNNEVVINNALTFLITYISLPKTNEFTIHLLQHNIINILPPLIDNNETASLALFLLGNIAAESPMYGQQMYSNDVIIRSAKALERADIKYVTEIRSTVCWLYSSLCLCDQKPQEAINLIIQTFCNILELADDQDCILSCLWGLSFICDTADDAMAHSIHTTNINKIVLYYLAQGSAEIKIPAVKFIGSIIEHKEWSKDFEFVNSSVENIECMVSSKLSDKALGYAIRAIGNIAAECEGKELERVAQSWIVNDVVTKIMSIGGVIVDEMIWFILNIVYNADDNILTNLLNKIDKIPLILIFAVTKVDATQQMISVALRGIINILELSQEVVDYVKVFEELKLDVICETLLNKTTSDRIHSRALEIYENYFAIDSEDIE